MSNVIFDIFLRDTQYLKDICIFLWIGPALPGIHLTEPYLSLLIDQKATHLSALLPIHFTEAALHWKKCI